MHWARGGDVGDAGHPMGQLVVHTVAVESGKVQAGSVCQCRPAGGERGGMQWSREWGADTVTVEGGEVQAGSVCRCKPVGFGGAGESRANCRRAAYL